MKMGSGSFIITLERPLVSPSPVRLSPAALEPPMVLASSSTSEDVRRPRRARRAEHKSIRGKQR